MADSCDGVEYFLPEIEEILIYWKILFKKKELYFFPTTNSQIKSNNGLLQQKWITN